MARFVSTSIPYVNARPHIGHALEFVQADFYARAFRARGVDLFFLTGTDDNALKNVQAAEKAGKPVQEFVDEHAQHFIDLAKRLEISQDLFIRTSGNESHMRASQKLWEACAAAGDLYTKTYSGYYCVGCEEFKTEKEIVNGECVLHPGKILEMIEEENWFFRLSKYQDALEKLISSDEYAIIPASRKAEMLAFTRNGLTDFSVSRSIARAHGWGIPVPGDDTQIMYVWFDALVNYLTGIGYTDDETQFKKYWTDAESRTHFIGKDITRFHAIYWPAMLLSAGLPVPSTLFSHGFITTDGQKMSKSVGNVIDPNELMDTYGVESVRYILLRHTSPFEDTDLNDASIKHAYTGDLVNGIGNLVARIMRLAEEHLAKPVTLENTDMEMEAAFIDRVEEFRFNEALDFVFEMVAECDGVMTEREPYKKVKSEDDGIREEGKHDISLLVRHLAKIATHLAPAMPESSRIILEAVRINKKPENLFPRLA